MLSVSAKGLTGTLRLCDRFVVPGAPSEINLSGSVRAATMANMQRLSQVSTLQVCPIGRCDNIRADIEVWVRFVAPYHREVLLPQFYHK